MSDRSSGVTTGANLRRSLRLRRASEQLESVLESLDLEDDREVADQVIEAIEATDRAYQAETGPASAEE